VSLTDSVNPLGGDAIAKPILDTGDPTGGTTLLEARRQWKSRACLATAATAVGRRPE